jgi:hypothetical protein
MGTTFVGLDCGRNVMNDHFGRPRVGTRSFEDRA